MLDINAENATELYVVTT